MKIIMIISLSPVAAGESTPPATLVGSPPLPPDHDHDIDDDHDHDIDDDHGIDDIDDDAVDETDLHQRPHVGRGAARGCRCVAGGAS